MFSSERTNRLCGANAERRPCHCLEPSVAMPGAMPPCLEPCYHCLEPSAAMPGAYHHCLEPSAWSHAAIAWSHATRCQDPSGSHAWSHATPCQDLSGSHAWSLRVSRSSAAIRACSACAARRWWTCSSVTTCQTPNTQHQTIAAKHASHADMCANTGSSAPFVLSCCSVSACSMDACSMLCIHHASKHARLPSPAYLGPLR